MIKTARGNIDHKVNKYVCKELNPEMMNSEFSVLFLKEKETFELIAKEEFVFCLNQGTVTFKWNDTEETVERKNCFIDQPIVLHVCLGTQVQIVCLSEKAEINVANTCNNRIFSNKLYGEKDFVYSGTVDMEKLDGKVKRIKREFFNRSTCPETNLFCGEVVNYPGSWACFPPHLHVEPEIYYYKFFPEQGYGFAEFGEEAIKVVNRSVTCNPGKQLHSQVTAPGYAGYIMWVQRLQDNGRDIVYKLDDQHAWLDRGNVKIFPERMV